MIDHFKMAEGGMVEISNTLRELTVEEKNRLDNDTRLVTDYKQKKFEQDAQKNWDLFYKRNTTKFFKDRHWTKREFSDLVPRQVRCHFCEVVQFIILS